MKKYNGIIIFLVFACLYSAFCLLLAEIHIAENTVKTPPQQYAFKGLNSGCEINYREKEALVFNFLKSNMLWDNGQILTNLKTDGSGENTLSESIGLLMEYCVLKSDKELFDKELRFLEEELLFDGRYVRWRTGEDIWCNALIDDLRIIGALLDAYDRWRDSRYLNIACFIQEGIYKKQVRGYDIYELYDFKLNMGKESIPLCYIDLYTINRLAFFNKSWRNICDKGISIIKNGKISNASPFFYKYYAYKDRKYFPDEEYKEGRGVCLTYTLYTVLHMAETNENTGFFTQWLKKELEKGKLYAWYDPYTSEPVQQLESTAVYALAAIYSKTVGEEELCLKLIDRMLDFMVDDINSPYYGGFGDEKTCEFYSFDNLTALYALALINDANE
ncbi:MAG TPA: glycoside hydrolase [Clostridiaceae bacterium]|nr:glycoside hydrolase [Clostridiaceae bacterium]